MIRAHLLALERSGSRHSRARPTPASRPDQRMFRAGTGVARLEAGRGKIICSSQRTLMAWCRNLTLLPQPPAPKLRATPAPKLVERKKRGVTKFPAVHGRIWDPVYVADGRQVELVKRYLRAQRTNGRASITNAVFPL